MIVKVELWAFREGEVREVEIPRWCLVTGGENDSEDILEDVFFWGQNEHQPREQPSVSMGDVAVLPNGERWMCCGVGWQQLSDIEYADHKQLDRIDRSLNAMKMGL